MGGGGTEHHSLHIYRHIYWLEVCDRLPDMHGCTEWAWAVKSSRKVLQRKTSTFLLELSDYTETQCCSTIRHVKLAVYSGLALVRSYVQTDPDSRLQPGPANLLHICHICAQEQ